MAIHNYLNLYSERYSSRVTQVIDTIKHELNMLEEDKKLKLVLYFHGGLSKSQYVYEKHGPYLQKTIFDNNNYKENEYRIFPVFIEYESGLCDINNLLEDIDNDVENIIIKYISKKLGLDKTKKLKKGMHLSDLNPDRADIKAIIEEDFALFLEEFDEYELFDKKLEESIEIIDGDAIDQIVLEESSYNLKNKMYKTSRYKIIKIIGKVFSRYIMSTQHGFLETILEEIIKETKFLNQKVKDHWSLVYDHSKSIWAMDKGKKFLECLNQLCADNSENISIDLLSHSAGSIPIAELFKKIALNQNAYSHINFINTIMIVPAINTKKFMHIINNQFLTNYFKIYTLSKEDEINDSLSVVPISMLELVSSIADSTSIKTMPIVGLSWFYDYQHKPPYTNCRIRCLRYDNYEMYGDINATWDFLHANEHIEQSGEFSTRIRTSSHSNTKYPYMSDLMFRKIMQKIGNMNHFPNINLSDWAVVHEQYSETKIGLC